MFYAAVREIQHSKNVLTIKITTLMVGVKNRDYY
jgi:hypothetical protein